jgi:hypothetical protein
MAGYIERLRSPSARALRDVGPPNGQIFAALSIAIVVALVVPNVGSVGTTLYTLGIAALLLTGVVSIADRNGWRIREAMAYIGLTQRARWQRGALPEDAAEAIEWLDNPANADASNVEWASMLMSADRWGEAGTLIADAWGSTPQEHATLVRMRSTIEGRSSGRIDPGPLRAAVKALPETEARYQLLAVAWSQAWLDIRAGRPWRGDLALAARELGPFELPARVRLLIAIEQLAAPIACIFAVVFIAFIAPILR